MNPIDKLFQQFLNRFNMQISTIIRGFSGSNEMLDWEEEEPRYEYIKLTVN
ncbi:MAG: hypothetical protein INQ03_24135 [Candidatus Heimdallarchaeota archaeon]|nr:hypothetical protein [Candidatus Heimdallarchaeota archaeon]